MRSPLHRAYQNTLACGTVLRQENGRVAGKYCGNRWCLVCNGIRAAKLRVAYEPVMQGWEDAHFVTLTVPNVPAVRLPGVIREMLATMPRIVRAMRRTDGLDVKGVRKLETTYSTRRGDYHPHLHLVVNSRAVAEAFVRRWLRMFPDASPAAQDVRRCDRGSAPELFKYFTKLTVKGMDGEHTAPPPYVLDTIFKAVRGLRTFQAMGFASPKCAVQAEDEAVTLDQGTASPSRRADAIVTWEWSSELVDWVDYETGEVLSGYDPTERMRRLIARIIRDRESLELPPEPTPDTG